MSCPICGKDTSHRYVPFCSRRCADVDLERWLSDKYSIPGTPEENAGSEAEPDDDLPN